MSGLSRQRWQVVSPYLDRALEMASHERTAWLAGLRASNPTLAADVQALLEERNALIQEDYLEGSPSPLLQLAPVTGQVAMPMDGRPLRIGSYRIVRELGRGGMGCVYLAEQTGEGFHRQVALKVVEPGVAGAELERRFRVERSILAGLEHPGIARFYDGGRAPDGRWFLALEYVEGVDLLEHARRRALPTNEKVQLFLAVLDAVEFAHARSIVHRDLKPSNILVGTDGRPRLLDFGIAKLIDPEVAVTETRTELRAFTPAYASPEQFRGERVTSASDVFSLGLVLYELLAGVRPFEAALTSRSALERAVLSEDPDPPSTAARRIAATTGPEPSTPATRSHGKSGAGLSRDLDAICLKALRKEPQERYASAAPFAQDLRSYLEARPVAARAGSRRYRLTRFMRRNQRRLAVAAALTLTAAAVVFALVTTRRGDRAEPTPGGRTMLAVLPFENLTGDAAQEYFSNGLTEEMIARVGSIDPRRLGTIARTSVMSYKGDRRQLEQIGRELGVEYVLEGSVRRAAGRVRIAAELVRASDRAKLWAREYDRELSSLLALQDEIAREIAGEIQLALGNSTPPPATQPARLPKRYEDYDLYLKGRHFWNKRTSQGLREAVESFEQAIAKDPTYARAYAGLADSYALIYTYGLAPAKDVVPKARAAALRALDLDERLAEAHTSLGLIAFTYDWDPQTAEKEYRRAIELDPNDPTAHHWYAEFLTMMGRFDEGLAEIDRARDLDPRSLIILIDRGAFLYFARQHERAIEQFRAVLDMDPNRARARMICYAYVEKGQFAEALAEVARWHRIEDSPWVWAVEAYVYGRWGRHAQARHAVQKLEQVSRRQRLDPTPPLLVAYAGMNDKTRALACLQKAYLEHAGILMSLRVDPIFDGLRGDPRFQEILPLIGLKDRPQ